MAYTRTTTVDSAPAGDTTKQAILDCDTDITAIFANLNTHEALTTGAHGVGAGTICGTTLTQTLTLKTLSSPTLTGTVTASGATITQATLQIPTIVTPTITGTVTASGATITQATLQIPTIVTPTLTGTVTASGSTITGGSTVNQTITTPTMTGGTSVNLTMTTPVLGTPQSGTLTNCTGLPQAGVTGLTTSSSPVFVTTKLSGLTDSYIPYHINDSTGFADSLLRANANGIAIGDAPTENLLIYSKTTTANYRPVQCVHEAVTGANYGLSSSATGTNADLNCGGYFEGKNATTNYSIYCVGNAYFTADVSALTFTDRTPFYKGDALADLDKIKGKGDEIDHDTLPDFAKTQDQEGNPRRDLGAMISILTVAVQQLLKRVKALEE